MLGFIGTGNMATAIIKGVIASEMLKGEDIAVYDITADKAKALSEEYGVRVFASENEIAQKCDKVVLSVKPNIFPSLLCKIDADLKVSNPLIISIAAGKTIDFISGCLSYDAKIVRVMPNINAKVGGAVSAYCGKENVSEDELMFVKALCESFGIAVNISENLFSAYSAIGGCSPAFAYMFIDSLARGAVKNGMPKDIALEVAAGAVLGSAKMILESNEHPWALVDQVCSPGGTTIEGVTSLKNDGFESAVMNAVQAAIDKDKRL
ncbi:MAG: pyrroline-5-carboxylate reductase [Clostridia bacterium]|nr:pyrroline-5-carboxylate reductase [Clostridia bacterium]